jgi:hypothetical protein
MDDLDIVSPSKDMLGNTEIGPMGLTGDASASTLLENGV